MILTLVFFGLLFLFGIKLWYEYHLIGKILLVFFYFGTVCMYILAKTEINKEVSSTSPEYVVLSFLALFLLPVLLILVPVAILFLIAMALRKDPPIKAAPLTPSNAYPDKKID